MKNKDNDKDNIKEKTKQEINTMLAYGSVGLGLNAISEDVIKSRIEEDIKKK